MAEPTQQLYLLGHPISHSKSPVMYNAVYEGMGLPWRYGLMDCATPDEAQAFLERRGFLALNITTPYKPLAFQVATHKAASAKLAGGANVLVKRGESLIAYNTDGQGCVSYLQRTGFPFKDAKVCVCGTGPTALAILHACVLAGAKEALLVGRDRDRAYERIGFYVDQYEQMVRATVDLGSFKPGQLGFHQAFKHAVFKFGSYQTSTQAIGQADLVINATPLGMKEGDPAPFDPSLLHKGQTAFDVVYGHGQTAFVAAARQAGCTVYDGGGMLVAQAVETVQTVCDLQGIDGGRIPDNLFDMMAHAADFDC